MKVIELGLKIYKEDFSLQLLVKEMETLKLKRIQQEKKKKKDFVWDVLYKNR